MEHTDSTGEAAAPPPPSGPTRQDTVRHHRIVVLMSVTMGVAAWLMMHLLPRYSGLQSGQYSLLFDDYASWPAVIRNFWPLAIVVCVLAWVPFWYFAMMPIGHRLTPFREISVTVCMLGGIGAAIGGGMGGWFVGIEFYFAGIAFVLVIFAILAAFMGAFFGLGWLLYKGWLRVWARLRPTAIGRTAARVDGYLSADDVKGDA
jgi:preprotein translocase subunit SecE